METAELDPEEVLVLLGSVPERLADMVAGLDENRLRYRHAPAFPTLLELINHLAQAGSGVDGLLRGVQLDGLARLDVRQTIDPPGDGLGETAPLAELLEDYGRVRRRSIDLLRGVEPEGWQRRLSDPQLGELSLLEVTRLITRHELGHLTQVRNLIAVLPEAQDVGPVEPVRDRVVPEPPETNGTTPA